MRSSSFRIFLTGCALAALVSPAVAQDGGAAEAASPPVVVVAPLEPAPAAAEAEADEVAAPPSPAAAPAIPATWSPVPLDREGRSAYGLYLSGRVAGIRGARAESAEFLARSHALAPEQPTIGEEAFRTALFSGDLETVVRLAPSVDETPLLAEAGRLFRIVMALDEGRARTGQELLREPFAAPYSSVARYLSPAIAAAAGDWTTALQPVEADGDAAAALILRLQRAQLLEARRRFDEAEAEYRILTARPEGAQLFGVDYGQFLERRGRREEAVARYRASLTGSSPDPAALDGMERTARRARPPAAPTPVSSAARALGFAALEAGEYDLHELAAIYLRLARVLAPEDDMIALRLGLSLAAARQEEQARQAFLQVGRANPIVYAGARYNLGLSLRREERQEEALEAFRLADAAAPGQIRIALEYAAQLMAMDRAAQALAVLDRPGIDTADQAAGVRFLRGAALQELDRIDEAEAELWAALQAAPEDPMMLNHLGYLWVDSGRRVRQGAEMIARAHAAEPDNGNIQDSLGWAQYRQGDYELAVQTLEGAVDKEPANAEINDHLGDAYWRVGRRREAGWQWSRVLTLETDPARRAAVERKLAEGLGPDEAAAPEGGRP